LLTLKDKIENLKELLDEEIDHVTKDRLTRSLIKLTTSPSLKRQKRSDNKQQPVVFIDVLNNYLGLNDEDQINDDQNIDSLQDDSDEDHE